MKKFICLAASLIMGMCLFTACGETPENPDGGNGTDITSPTQPEKVNYDANGVNNLYYQNAVAQFGSAPIMGDPFLYYDEEEKLFYLYGTTGGKKFDYYISKDLKEWEMGGTCFDPTVDDWCHDRLWAPEMHKIGDKYWLYYSAGANSGATLHCSVAVGDSPAGPFTNYITDGADGSKPRFDFGFATIDGTVFVDDNGKMYYYFAKDQVRDDKDYPSFNVSTIWGVELENPYTVKEGARPVQLTRVGYSSMDASAERREWEDGQGKWNEGPFMVKHNDMYYLTYSANFYQSKYYGVGYAMSADPLSGFYKPDDSMLLGSEKKSDAGKEWDYVSGTGHHMFLDIGGQSYIVYHKHYNIKEGGTVRIFTMDAYGFRGDGSMFVNGSTITPQPLPEVLSGYRNVAGDATVSGKGLNAQTQKLLKDGGIGVYPKNSDKTDVLFSAGKTTITLKFAEPTKVRAVLLYCGTEYDKLLKKVDKIEFGDVCYVTDVRLDGNYINTRREYMAIGNAISATLYGDVTVNQIKITINSDDEFSLSEIMVLGN